MKKLRKPEAARSREKEPLASTVSLPCPFSNGWTKNTIAKSVALGLAANSAKKCPVRMPLNLDCFISLQFNAIHTIPC